MKCDDANVIPHEWVKRVVHCLMKRRCMCCWTIVPIGETVWVQIKDKDVCCMVCWPTEPGVR